MAQKKADPKKVFTVSYNNEKLIVHSADQMLFYIEFPDGRTAEMRFEINTEMDLQWRFVPDESTAGAREIGSLIEGIVF